MNLTKFYFNFSFRYFLYGKKDFKYEGARNGDAFIKFMEDPKEENEEPAHAQEQQWKTRRVVWYTWGKVTLMISSNHIPLSW